MILLALLALCAQDPAPLARVSAQGVPAPSKQLVLRSYGVADLCGHSQVHEQRRKLLQHIPWDATDPGVIIAQSAALDHAQAEASAALADIESIVRSHLKPAFDPARNLVRTVTDSSLLVLGDHNQQAWVQTYLETCRQFERLIRVDTVILNLPAGSLETLGHDHSGQVLPRTDADGLIAAAKRIPGATILEVPSVVTSPFRRANLTAVDQVAYIKDFELIVLEEEQQEIVDPVVDVAQDGVVLDITATPVEGGRFSLDAHLTYSVLERPIRTFETSIGALGHKVTVQLPEITISRLKGEFVLSQDQSLAIASTGPDGEGEVLMLMSVKSLPFRGR